MVNPSEIHKFYRITNNSNFQKKYTWAISIVEEPDIVEKKCPKCSQVVINWSGSFSVILEGGREYPDVLGCGVYPMLIVSETVVASWENENVSGYAIVPLSISKVRSDKLKNKVPPKYFRVIVTGKCSIDLKKSGYSNIEVCSNCGNLIGATPLDLIGHFMIPGSWSGDDIFRDGEKFPARNFCTEKLLKIAREYRLTNFRFERMTDPYDFGSQGIKYLE